MLKSIGIIIKIGIYNGISKTHSTEQLYSIINVLFTQIAQYAVRHENEMVEIENINPVTNSISNGHYYAAFKLCISDRETPEL